MTWKTLLILVLGSMLLGNLLVACSSTPESCPDCSECPACPEVQCPDCPTAEPCAECPVCPEAECAKAPTASRFAAQWAESPHADAEAEAFTHWDAEDPPELPADCAKCHSEGGYLDFLGVDGTAVRVVDNDHPVGTVVTCDACHNQVTPTLDAVVFPSGAQITGLGPEARCMECHQGRASTKIVDDAIAEAGLQDMDTVSGDLGFTNIHYFAAAATMYGTLTQGGYEYPEKAYDGKHDHVPGLDTCVDCHDMHTLELKVETCANCHTEVDPRDRRMAGSRMDYDGDGDIQEGIFYEIEGLQEMLYKAIQAYANEVSGTPVVYEASTYPYFFIDTNADGEAGEEDFDYSNRYNAWTGRLARAAYNYQTSIKDPGAYAHGGKYIIQLLYDSIENLNEALSSPVDLTRANRIDHGHFAGSERAFRNWDEEGIVPGVCSRCHTKDGLPLYITEAAEISQKPSNGLNCATCHDDLTTFSIYEVPWVRFPRGTLVDSGDPSTNLCLNCHQGRSSIATINGAIAGRDLDAVAEDLEFINIHYFAAGATLYGTEVQGAYEYANDEGYVGRLAHVEPYRNCSQCHDIHRQDVFAEECAACHPDVETQEDLVDIRFDPVDYDGDGDITEGIAGEIDTVRQALYAAIQGYAATTAGTPIIYEPHTYPYFFIDSDGDAEVGEGEASFPDRYATWTPRLLRAAYNYQYAMKDPGAFAHNPKYVLQILYDSLADLEGEATGMVRPVTAP